MTDVFFAWTPGPLEIVLVAIAALLLFGKRLPELAKSLGKSVTLFKKGLNEVQDEVKETIDSAGNTDVEKEKEETRLEG